MARNITAVKIKKFGLTVPFPEYTGFEENRARIKARDDGKTLLLIKNSGEGSALVTVKAGTGLQGAGDFTFSLENSATVCLCLESGKFYDRGVINITASREGVRAAAVELP